MTQSQKTEASRKRIAPQSFLAAFERYETAVIIKPAGPNVGQAVTLAIEKEVMLSLGCSLMQGLSRSCA